MALTESELRTRINALENYKSWVKARKDFANPAVVLVLRRAPASNRGATEAMPNFQGLEAQLKPMVMARYDAKIHIARRQLVALGIEVPADE